jgi:hypothetical protein
MIAISQLETKPERLKHLLDIYKKAKALIAVGPSDIKDHGGELMMAGLDLSWAIDEFEDVFQQKAIVKDGMTEKPLSKTGEII